MESLTVEQLADKVNGLIEFMDKRIVTSEVKNGQLLDLIFDFITDYELEDKFSEFLKQNKDDEKFDLLDVEFMLMDYK